MLVIGNGESRRNIDIDQFACKKVGCNAIYRDFEVDYLICVDRKICTTALQHNNIPVYTRDIWYQSLKNYKYCKVVPQLPYSGEKKADDPFHWGSGPYAVLLACQLSKEIHLIGFDLYALHNKVNNIYKGTEFYADTDSHAVDPRYWVYQLAKIFEYFPTHSFTVYNNLDWKKPESWQFDNLFVKYLDKLQDLY